MLCTFLTLVWPWLLTFMWVAGGILSEFYSQCLSCCICLGVFVPLNNFSLIWRRYHYRWRAANFDLFSALMTFEQWGYFSVSHLLWQWASVYNDLWGPSGLLAVGIRTPNLPLAWRTLYPTAPSPRRLTKCKRWQGPILINNITIDRIVSDVWVNCKKEILDIVW